MKSLPERRIFSELLAHSVLFQRSIYFEKLLIVCTTVFTVIPLSFLLVCMCRTLPAGFMEIGESAVEGAIRETWEEANAKVEVLSPFAQLDIPLIGHVRRIICLNIPLFV